ncbi:MAG: class I SAM-dependent methyltransferase [Dysgonamonadaceae bacterium]|jgi:predicted O-methyltransferase YrrM|nr:class I SAM-dependent methyltransferase [Dysgonamonadaceae bacterium]
MNSLKNSIKNILWKFWLYRGIKSLKKTDPLQAKIRCAIAETIRPAIGQEAKGRIREIEQLRNRFAQDETPVIVTDYGAGNPDSRRSENEMQQGFSQTATYGDISLGSKPALWAFLLFNLIKIFQPLRALELGTCIGISASYQATAQKLNGKGRLITIEGSEAIAALARKNIRSLQLDNVEVVCGRFKDVLPAVLQDNQPFDCVFIDGHHDEQATIDYFEMILPALSSGALLIFDDISWSVGMKNAWQKISCDERIALAVDLKMLGLCLIRVP